MSSYTKKERLVAQFLEKFPALKIFIKYLYQRLVYLKNFKLDRVFVNDSWELKDPFLGVNGHTFFGYYDKPSLNINGDLLTHVVSKGYKL